MKPIPGIDPRFSASSSGLHYTVTDLGVLPGFESSFAKGVNDRGQVIGSLYSNDKGFPSNSFLWSDGQMRDLGKIGLSKINNKGQIAGTKLSKNLRGSASYFNSGKFEKLFKETSASSMAYGINDSGQVVGVLQSPWKGPADIKRGCFIWENGKRRYLGIPEGYRAGTAVGINNRGQIAGEIWRGASSESYACLWSENAIILFPEPSEFSQSKAIVINNQGQILVRAFHSDIGKLFEYLIEGEPKWDFTTPKAYDSAAVEKQTILYQQKIDALPKGTFVSRWQYFLWENGEMQPIGGIAKAFNDYGQVVGRWIGSNGAFLTSEEIALAKSGKAPYAFLWQNNEMLDLNDLLPTESGWQLTEANGINNRGQIVGYGEIGGKTRAFLLTPIFQS